MKKIFLPDSPYTRQARFIAIIWTLLIFVGCLYPGKELPKVDVPLIDKWTHLVLFGGFTFLWLCARPVLNFSWVVAILLIAAAVGAAIELLQGSLPFLSRSMELMDFVADSLGGLLGLAFFRLCVAIARK